MSQPGYSNEMPRARIKRMLILLEVVRNNLEIAGMPKKPGNCDAAPWVTDELAGAYIDLNRCIEGFEAHLGKS